MSDPCEINECDDGELGLWGCLRWLIPLLLLGLGLLLLLSRGCSPAGSGVAGPTVTAIPANTIAPNPTITPLPTSTPRPAPTSRPDPTAVPAVVVEPTEVPREVYAPVLGALSADAVEGEMMTLSGTAVPYSIVDIYQDGERVNRAFAGEDGTWMLAGVPVASGSAYYVLGQLVDGTSTGESNTETLGDVAAPAPAGDGSIQVMYANADGDSAGIGDSATGAPALSMILDSSWSMTFPVDYTGIDVGADTDESQRVTSGDPSSRIFVAKQGLAELVENELPNGMPSALRVFGNLQGDLACQTSLMVPYAPLDRGAMAGTISAVDPQFNANTAIAASLAAVADDLAGAAEASRNIVLVTDGDETCGGDPAAEIAALVDAGFDVTVNIVGFAINDDNTRSRLTEWAEAGNGQYYDAPNAGALVDSLRSAFALGYSVQDGAGNTVALGTVGGPAVAVPAGSYSIVVNTAPVQQIDVDVAGDAIVVTTE